ncbi:hypothetical protein KA005_20165 [bacterium]|nr:hypothetical protein [bacterium]
MGCYLLFCCRDWSKLRQDVEALENEFVSLTLVTDTFGEFELDELRKCFNPVIRFKEHFITNLFLPVKDVISRYHRKYSRRALHNVQVEVTGEP